MTTDLGGLQAPPAAAGSSSLARNAPWGEIFVSGQLGVDPRTGALREGGIIPQTEQAIDNLALALASLGCGLREVLKVSVFLADLDDLNSMNAVYARRFSLPFPALTTVQAGIARGALVEIEAVAHTRQINQEAD
jgi:2-iminobutanoate/2-iminopropanoate deaminase